MEKHRALTTADGEEAEDYFERLPDDVIIDIFDRVNDFKLLTQCLLVSKRFASLVHLVSSVFINIHLGRVKQNPINCNQVRLQCKINNPSQPDDSFESWSEAFLLNDLACLFKCMAREALQPFSKVKSAVVFNKYFRMDTLSWMMEYSGGGVNIIKTGAFLTQIHHNPLSSRIINYQVASFFRLALTFLPMVAEMAHDHESLRDILVTTASRKGLIRVAEDEIVKMRQTGGSANKLKKMMEKKKVHKKKRHMKVTEKEKVHMKLKVWYIPVPNKSMYYIFVVVSSSDNIIDREVKAITRRFWSDSSYWAGHHENVIQEDGVERKLRELVETKPCNFEYVWEGIIMT